MWSRDAVLELGRRAFESYPLRVAPEYELALTSAGAADEYGLWVDDRGRLGGLVAVESDVGPPLVATTCASCHGRVDQGRLVHGAGSPVLDQGIMFHRYRTANQPMPPPDALLDWGPGHVDPTEDGMDNPTGIPDLRPVRYQNHLNAAATLRNSLMALTVRTETLLITGAGTTRRPPREVAFAIAYYLWSLGEPAEPGELSAAEARGRDYFALTCARCHHADGTSAAPVELAEVGTDPATGLSPFRGTGYYRIPSLYKVADRQRLLHRSFLGSLEEMFDPDRQDAVPGHPFGLDLTDAERADLLAFVRTIGYR